MDNSVVIEGVGAIRRLNSNGKEYNRNFCKNLLLLTLAKLFSIQPSLFCLPMKILFLTWVIGLTERDNGHRKAQ